MMAPSTDPRPLPAGIRIARAQAEHGAGVAACVRAAYGVTAGEGDEWCIRAEDLRQQVQRFPAGQFVALAGERVVGYASTMRTHRPPDQPALKWIAAIGDMGIAAHEAAGDWLYGVEMTVRPEWQGRGVGAALYEARFALVRRLSLRGWYAGGMLIAYPQYADRFSPQEYAVAVQQRQLRDPTVTMQMNRGFRAVSLIEEYLPGEPAMLILWENPERAERSLTHG
ncbi:MAG: GNAT family N-acetyltransferase [Chloroflexi bacterium]|nr:GNAT family N-acetyltransferase [Chloroflexota bacterium]